LNDEPDKAEPHSAPASTRKNRMKLLATLVAVLVGGLAASGQGLLYFANTPASGTWIATNSIPGGPTTGYTFGQVGSYFYALFVAPTTQTSVDSSLSGWTFTGNYATNTSIPGRLDGNYTVDHGVVISNTFPGMTVSLVVVGWSANMGHDYSAVESYLANPTFDAWYGVSQIATTSVGGGETGPVIFFGSGSGQMLGFSLNRYTIPEPSTFGLAMLCAAVWWKSRLRR